MDFSRIKGMALVLGGAAAVGFVMQNEAASRLVFGEHRDVELLSQAPAPKRLEGIELTSARADDLALDAMGDGGAHTPELSGLGGPDLPALPAEALAPTDLPQPAAPSIQVAALDDVTLPQDNAGSDLSLMDAEGVETDLAIAVVPASTRASRSEGTPEDAIAPSDTVEMSACQIEMTATPTVAAMVNLGIDAPCLANDRVTLHHNGMMITETTDADGSLEITVPALAEQAVFIASFSNGAGAMARTEVSALSLYDRVVVQWKGLSGLELHALEYGAPYFSAGHVWAEAARSPESASDGTGGFIMPLGNPDAPSPLLAEVYTFPTETARQSGLIDLSVEAEVTDLNCGREIAAQTLEVHGGAVPKVKDLTLPMPACDATGDYLVLKNLLQDLSIAAR